MQNLEINPKDKLIATSDNEASHQSTFDKTSYFTKGGDIDSERLQIVNEIYNPKSFNFLIKSGLKPGMHVLEIGCGYAHSAIWLASQVAPNGGSVTAIDFSEATLNIARQNAKNAGITNIDFICLDISNINQLKTKTPINFIYGRWVIEFCKSSPYQVLQDLYSILAPGGIFTYETGNFIDTGIKGVPENSVIDKWVAMGLANFTRNGNELNMARRIPIDLEKLGYTHIKLERNHPTLSTPEQKRVFRLGLVTAQERILANKVMGIDRSGMDQFIEDCRYFEADETKRAKFYDVTLIRGTKPF